MARAATAQVGPPPVWSILSDHRPPRTLSLAHPYWLVIIIVITNVGARVITLIVAA